MHNEVTIIKVIYKSPALVKIQFLEDVMLCCCGLVPDVLRDHGVFVFVDCLTLEVKVLWSFKISETVHLMTA
jgi:hypothetical protein